MILLEFSDSDMDDSHFGHYNSIITRINRNWESGDDSNLKHINFESNILNLITYQGYCFSLSVRKTYYNDYSKIYIKNINKFKYTT